MPTYFFREKEETREETIGEVEEKLKDDCVSPPKENVCFKTMVEKDCNHPSFYVIERSNYKNEDAL